MGKRITTLITRKKENRKMREEGWIITVPALRVTLSPKVMYWWEKERERTRVYRIVGIDPNIIRFIFFINSKIFEMRHLIHSIAFAYPSVDNSSLIIFCKVEQSIFYFFLRNSLILKFSHSSTNHIFHAIHDASNALYLHTIASSWLICIRFFIIFLQGPSQIWGDHSKEKT